MALIRRTALVSVAALTLAGVAVQPAQAYWQATGRGTGTVPTATAAANVLTRTQEFIGARMMESFDLQGQGQSGTDQVPGSWRQSARRYVGLMPCESQRTPMTSSSGGGSIHVLIVRREWSSWAPSVQMFGDSPSTFHVSERKSPSAPDPNEMAGSALWGSVAPRSGIRLTERATPGRRSRNSVSTLIPSS